jgi:AcrR family transcriptional regulator
MEPIRRDQIRRAAVKLIAKHGFDGTTLTQVAKAAGVSTGAIHHYYENKLALLVDTLVYVSEWFQQSLRKAIALEPTGLAKLRSLISVGIFEDSRLARDGECVWLWALSEAIRSRTMRNAIHERRQLFQVILADVIQSLDEAAMMSEAEIAELAAEFDAFLCGLAFHRATGERKIQPEEVERSLLAMVTARTGDRSASHENTDMLRVYPVGANELSGS